jgi:hypothetical protein
MRKDDPLRAQAESLRESIYKKRSKIKSVSHVSQKALWGKKGGYDPANEESKKMIAEFSKKLKS